MPVDFCKRWLLAGLPAEELDEDSGEKSDEGSGEKSGEKSGEDSGEEPD